MIAKQTVPSLEDFAAPVVALNRIALSYTEKLVELNLAVLRKQADVTLAAWREALAVKDADQANDYFTRQGEVASDVVKGYVANVRAITDLNQEVAKDVREVVEESVGKAVKQAA
jgi:phasin family protein